jgi:hypothetical protein
MTHKSGTCCLRDALSIEGVDYGDASSKGQIVQGTHCPSDEHPRLFIRGHFGRERKNIAPIIASLNNNKSLVIVCELQRPAVNEWHIHKGRFNPFFVWNQLRSCEILGNKPAKSMQKVMNGTDYARLSEYLYNFPPPLYQVWWFQF